MAWSGEEESWTIGGKLDGFKIGKWIAAVSQRYNGFGNDCGNL